MSAKKQPCGQKTEIYSRVVGYYRPVQNWNKGKKEEFSGRRTFDIVEATADTAAAKPRPCAAAAEARDERLTASA